MLSFLLFNSEEQLNESQKILKTKYLEQLNFADLKDIKDELNGNKITSILNLGMPLYKNKFDVFNDNLELYQIEYLDSINSLKEFEDEDNEDDDDDNKKKKERISQIIEIFNNKIENITGRMENDFIDIELFKGVKFEFNYNTFF